MEDPSLSCWSCGKGTADMVRRAYRDGLTVMEIEMEKGVADGWSADRDV
jgi:hypothetical protein